MTEREKELQAELDAANAKIVQLRHINNGLTNNVNLFRTERVFPFSCTLLGRSRWFAIPHTRTIPS